MKKNYSNIIFLAAVIFLVPVSCLRLDDQFYNTQKIDQYLLDAYDGDRELKNMPAQYSVDADKITLFTLRSDDNGDVQDIYAIYLGEIDSIAVDTVILYCHGNKHHMDLYWNRAKLLANVNDRHQYGVLMMDYRGFGMSTGETTESGIYADVSTCMDWLKSKGLTDDRLIIYGYSLGSAPATRLSAEPGALRPSRLLLEAPFSSAATMINDAAIAALPVSYFTDVRLDVGEKIKSVDQPLCWIHGIDDDFLDIDTHGEVVFANHPGPDKIAHRIPDAVHNNVPEVMGYEAYLQAVGHFIRE
jgi:pimeloyl-ACP methyl ester carboxylesterase